MGDMTAYAKGPIAAEIEKRLQDALRPERLEVVDDSAKHRGHAGHDPRGESHFTVTVVAQAFAGQSRVARQRMVNAALADLLRDRVHALAMVTKAPGEA
jgi:BolA protein